MPLHLNSVRTYLLCVFVDTQDNANRVNPCIRTNIFKHLKKNLTKQEKDTDGIAEDMKKWYDTSINSNLDRILSAFTQKENSMSQVVAPLHNNVYFVMLDFILPYLERINGEATISNYLHKAVN